MLPAFCTFCACCGLLEAMVDAARRRHAQQSMADSSLRDQILAHTQNIADQQEQNKLHDAAGTHMKYTHQGTCNKHSSTWFDA
jgi:hypothetical protein